MEKALQKNWICEICFLSLGDVDPKKVDKMISAHKNSVTNNVRNKKFPCLSCDKSFSDSWKLKRHEKTHIKNLEEADLPSQGEKVLSDKAMDFNCQKCDKTFNGSLKLKEHIKVHFEGEVKPKISVSAEKVTNFIKYSISIYLLT